MKHLLEELLHFLGEQVWDGLWESAKAKTQTIGACVGGSLVLMFFYVGFVEWHRWSELGARIFLGPACSIALTFALFWGGWLLLVEKRIFPKRRQRPRRKRAKHGFLVEVGEFGSIMPLIFGSWLIPWFGLLAVREDTWFALRVAAVVTGFIVAFVLLMMWVTSEDYAPWFIRALTVCGVLAISVWYSHYGPKDPFGIVSRLEKYEPHISPRSSGITPSH